MQTARYSTLYKWTSSTVIQIRSVHEKVQVCISLPFLLQHSFDKIALFWRGTVPKSLATS